MCVLLNSALFQTEVVIVVNYFTVQFVTAVLISTSPPELVPAASVIHSSEKVSSNLTLSCTVRGDGKFSWSWTGPQSPVTEWTSDFTRTSTALFTRIRRLNEGDTKYTCHATYDPMIPMTGGGFLMLASHNFTIELQCEWIYIEIVTRLLSFFTSNSHVVFNQVTFALYNKFDRTEKSTYYFDCNHIVPHL